MSVASNVSATSTSTDGFPLSRASGSGAEEGLCEMKESDVSSSQTRRVNIWDDSEPDNNSQQVSVYLSHYFSQHARRDEQERMQ